MRAQLIKSLFAMIAMILGISLVSPSASAKTGFDKFKNFKPMSAKELQKKSPAFRTRYMNKLANFVADYESIVNRANDGGFTVPKTENAQFMEIFSGSEAYAANSKGIWKKSRTLVDKGSPCPIAGGIGVQGARYCQPPERLRCTTDSGQPGVGCAPEVFGTRNDGKMHCGAITPGKGVGRDFSRVFCLAERNKIPPAQQLKNDTRDINARARAAGRTGRAQWVWEIENYRETVGKLCIDTAEKLGIPASQATSSPCNANPNVDGLGAADAGTVIFLNNNLCACTGVQTRFEDIPETKATKEVADFMTPFKCIKDAFAGQGQDVSDKYLAMLGTHIQALGYRNGDNSTAGPGKQKGTYELGSLESQTDNVMNNYTYEKKRFGYSKKANPSRGILRRPATCPTGPAATSSSTYKGPNAREEFGQTPSQLFLRRMVENIEAKGWCSSQAYPWSTDEKSMSNADRQFLNKAISGEPLASRATPYQKAYFQNLSKIFGVDGTEPMWKGTFFLNSNTSWTQGSLHDRSSTYQQWKDKLDQNAVPARKYSGDAKACFGETTTKSKSAKTDLCLAMAQSCGLSPAICNKSKRCVDVSGYAKAGDGNGRELTGNIYKPKLPSPSTTTPPPVDRKTGR